MAATWCGEHRWDQVEADVDFVDLRRIDAGVLERGSQIGGLVGDAGGAHALAREARDARHVAPGQRDDRCERPLDERGDRDHAQAVVAREQELGLVGDRHVYLARREQLQGFGGVGGRLGPHVQADGGEVAVADRRVERGVVGVGEEVEHHRHALGAGRAQRVLLFATARERGGAGEHARGQAQAPKRPRVPHRAGSPGRRARHGASLRSASARA